VSDIGARSQLERRRAPRYAFKAASVLTEAGSFKIIVALTGDLSGFGCFVQAGNAFPHGTNVQIDMRNEGATFAATGKVAYATDQGMGIEFISVEAGDQEILERWLADEESIR
jgi:PilZ domain